MELNKAHRKIQEIRYAEVQDAKKVYKGWHVGVEYRGRYYDAECITLLEAYQKVLGLVLAKKGELEACPFSCTSPEGEMLCFERRKVEMDEHWQFPVEQWDMGGEYVHFAHDPKDVWECMWKAESDFVYCEERQCFHLGTRKRIWPTIGYSGEPRYDKACAKVQLSKGFTPGYKGLAYCSRCEESRETTMPAQKYYAKARGDLPEPARCRRCHSMHLEPITKDKAAAIEGGRAFSRMCAGVQSKLAGG